MKISALFTGLFFIFGLNSLSAQTDDPEQNEAVNVSMNQELKKKETEEHLQKIFRMVEGRNYAGFAQNMAYTGPDESRELKFPINFDDPYEKLTAENTCNLIRSWIDKSILYHFTRFSTTSGVGNQIYIWEVEFSTKKGKVTSHRFMLSPYRDKYLLARIEK